MKLLQSLIKNNYCILFLGDVRGFDPDYTIVNRLNQFLEASFNSVLFVTTEESKPIEEEVTFWCSNRYSLSHIQICPIKLTSLIIIFHHNSRHQKNYVQVSLNDNDIAKKLVISLPLTVITHGWFDSAHRNWVKSSVSGRKYYIIKSCSYIINLYGTRVNFLFSN